MSKWQPGFEVETEEQSSTDDYADLLLLSDTQGYIDCRRWGRTVRIFLKNTHATNVIKWKVLGCDHKKAFDFDEKAEATLAAATSVTYQLSNYYPYIRIQIKANAAGNQGKAKAYVAGVPG